MKGTKRLLLLIWILLLAIPTFTFAEDAPARAEGALPCAYTVPEEVESYAWHLYDGDPFTTVTLYGNESIAMSIPSGAKVLFFQFFEPNQVYTLNLFNADNRMIDSIRGTTTSGFVRVPLDGTAVTATLVSGTRFLAISEWYAAANESLLPFPDTGDTADVLVVLNSPGDELKKLGAVLPMLCGEHGLSAQVMYMTAADGYRSTQCLEVLRKMGITRAPIFGKGRDAVARSDNMAINVLETTQDLLMRTLTTQIRTCRPQIVITLDPAVEQTVYIDGFIARSVIKAVDLAADPGSYKGFDTIKVNKLYTLSESGETVCSGEQLLYAYDGVRAAALADELYKTYLEERVFRRDMPDTVRFHLEASHVGKDRKGTDLLENLSLQSFADYRDLTPTPAPTPEPTPEPTEEPTQEPAAAPTQEPADEPTEKPAEPEKPTEEPEIAETPKKASLWWLPAAIGAVCAVAAWFLIPKRSLAKILLCLLPLIAGVVISVFMMIDAKKAADKAAEVPAVTTEAPTAEPTPEPTEIPSIELTPAPTAEPTPEPTEEPTPSPTPEPTPDPNDAYFLSGEGEEYALDFENGHWWYKNNVLSIDIEEIHIKMEQDHPLIYYVADIRMRDFSSYRSGVRPFVQPWVYTRYEKAVFAITGDNLDQAEKQLKGCLLRQGKFYWNARQADTLVIENDMSLSVIHRGEGSERVLMDHGIRDTYGFGPILVENGEVSDSTIQNRVDHPNPRCGIGMIEPGHWVAIATEGRQTDFSYSITLEYFAQLFVDRGCTVAYNMDGGSSVGVVFMGEALNRHYKRGTSDTQRPWTDAMMFGYSEDVPSPDIPTVHDGFRHDF